MSRIFQKALSLLAIAALGFVAIFAAAPAADAQYAPNSTADPMIIFFPTGGPGGTISGGQGAFNVTYVATATDGTTITVGAFVVAHQGDFTPPAGFFDGLPAGSYTVRATVVGADLQTHVNSFKLVVKATAAGVPIAVPVAKPVAAPHPNLAFTGNEVSLPITAGAILIGSGGLLLLAANKRNRKA